MAQVSEFIILEWVILNTILIIVSAVFISKCYKEKRNREIDASVA
jgi:hypothetical protein